MYNVPNSSPQFRIPILNFPRNLKEGEFGKTDSMNAAAAISLYSSFSFSFSSALIQHSQRASFRTLNLRNSPFFFPVLNFSSSSMDNNMDSDPCTSLPKPKPKPKPWLIVGLGNPGKMYNRTRHNVGFEMVDAIAETQGIPITSVSYRALFGKGLIGNVPVILAKPQTFMNASGESVGQIVSYYKIPLQQVLVIYDDMDLPLAKLRLLPKGGHGGHNGMRNIIDHFKGSRDFPRLRIGIGRPTGKMDAVNYVLRQFSKRERQELDFSFQIGMEALRIMLLEGFNKSATFVNSTKPFEQLT